MQAVRGKHRREEENIHFGVLHTRRGESLSGSRPLPPPTHKHLKQFRALQPDAKKKTTLLALGGRAGRSSAPFLGVIAPTSVLRRVRRTPAPGVRHPRPAPPRARVHPPRVASYTQTSTGPGAPPEAPGERTAANPRVGARLPRKRGWAVGRGHSPRYAVGALAHVRKLV